MVAPSCSTGKTDMFEKSDWDFSAYTNGCLKNWKVKPNINWIETQYWGKNLSAASNIIFRSEKVLHALILTKLFCFFLTLTCTHTSFEKDSSSMLMKFKDSLLYND